MTDLKQLEKLFFKVIDDLEEYLPYLVLVGGWVPYLYVKYLWKNIIVYPVTTSDIDFGVGEINRDITISESIYSKISKMRYKERHLRMDRMFPIVPILEDSSKTSRIIIEFITTPDVNQSYIERLVGRQILVNRIDKFDIPLKDSIQISITNRDGGRSYHIYVPPPHIFLFHKALVFVERENEAKKSKDLYYVYYILRFHPEKKVLFDELKKMQSHEEKRLVAANLKKFFSHLTSEGCIMVEQENGPDVYIDDVRKDAFERFTELIRVFDF